MKLIIAYNQAPLCVRPEQGETSKPELTVTQEDLARACSVKGFATSINKSVYNKMCAKNTLCIRAAQVYMSPWKGRSSQYWSSKMLEAVLVAKRAQIKELGGVVTSRPPRLDGERTVPLRRAHCVDMPRAARGPRRAMRTRSRRPENKASGFLGASLGFVETTMACKYKSRRASMADFLTCPSSICYTYCVLRRCLLG